MPAKRLIYATAARATAYVWSRGHLAVEASFPAGEEGTAAFASYVGAVSSSLFYVLADVVEEDFHQENIPYIRGKDRRALLDRKLAQRYRDTSLSTSISLGVDRGQRAEERVVLSSFTNTQQLHPWLLALRDADAAIVGVYSAALIAPLLTNMLGLKKVPCLMVALSQAGLRQSYVERGQIRFSRLGPLEAAEIASPERTAEAFERETTRVHQYLMAMRVLPREGGTIDTVLIAPPGQAEAVRDAAPSIAQLRLQVLDLDNVRRKIGLRSAPAGAGAEALYLHLLASRPPRQQYAKENLRGAYRVHQWRVGLVAGGAAVLAACLLFAGLQAWEMLQLRDSIAQNRQLAASAEQSYSRVTAQFPAMPTSTDNLRAAMDQYRLLAAQTRNPRDLLAEVSQVLSESPRIEVERLKWEFDGKLPDVAKEAGPGGTVQQGEKPRYEIVELTARVQATRASDYRGIQLLVNQFVDELQKRPGVEVLARKLPFELNSGTQLSGDIGTERASAVPEFTVTVARKIAP
ncbi:MAG: hypothetical protein LJE97_12215 [Betaproteobacteria bacterium]|jgi:hypothetical protein|nr:hypothetical protein [Betaproteobacteria bacterium]